MSPPVRENPVSVLEEPLEDAFAGAIIRIEDRVNTPGNWKYHEDVSRDTV